MRAFPKSEIEYYIDPLHYPQDQRVFVYWGEVGRSLFRSNTWGYTWDRGLIKKLPLRKITSEQAIEILTEEVFKSIPNFPKL